jgi:hypothetical protein
VDVAGAMDVLVVVVGTCVAGGTVVAVAGASLAEAVPPRRCLSVDWAVVVVGLARTVVAVGP